MRMLRCAQGHVFDGPPDGTGECPACKDRGVVGFGFANVIDVRRALQGESLSPSITDRFKVIRELARGGMGRIVLAQELSSARFVALKLMLGEAARREELVHQFIREAVITARLEHANIIPVYELGFFEHHQLYYTMRYVDGRAFSSCESLPVKARLNILREAAKGVAHAHRQGLFHRDLKPSNILVDRFGGVFVVDWGLVSIDPGRTYSLNIPSIVIEERALHLPDDLLERTNKAVTTNVGAIVGTPRYMPLEGCEGRQEVSRRADAWAFGIMLVETLTGQHPLGDVDGGGLFKIVTALNGFSPSQLTFPSDTPKAIADLARDCLSMDPAKRPEVADIARVLEGVGPSTSESDLATIFVDANEAENVEDSGATLSREHVSGTAAVAAGAPEGSLDILDVRAPAAQAASWTCARCGCVNKPHYKWCLSCGFSFGLPVPVAPEPVKAPVVPNDPYRVPLPAPPMPVGFAPLPIAVPAPAPPPAAPSHLDYARRLRQLRLMAEYLHAESSEARTRLLCEILEV